MNDIVFFSILLITSYAFANLEIEIEGGHGWAENLPTWKIPEDHCSSSTNSVSR